VQGGINRNQKRKVIRFMNEKPKEKPNLCSICGQDYYGYGNNALPINDGRCCDDCNQLVIIRRINDVRRRIE
jgi:hypothetical protein